MKEVKMKFSGSNVLITGASRGIGAAVAKLLSTYDLKIWINYNNSEDSAINVKNEILLKNSQAKVEIIKFDVADVDAYRKSLNHIIEVDGKLDYLVNNAGITKDNLSILMSIEDYDDVMNINAKSCFLGSKEALKTMASNRFGSVVNVSSITAEMGNAGQSNYAASKGAIIAMTKSFAQEGAARNVRFNVVTPGLISTDMVASLSDEMNTVFMNKIPLKRFGTADDVANGIAFLLSDYAEYITGEVMKINGGMYM